MWHVIMIICHVNIYITTKCCKILKRVDTLNMPKCPHIMRYYFLSAVWWWILSFPFIFSQCLSLKATKKMNSCLQCISNKMILFQMPLYSETLSFKKRTGPRTKVTFLFSCVGWEKMLWSYSLRSCSPI